MFLSIIVPAYNVAPYIERCIRSLEAQDIPKNEYEIIVTNDGSPDNCKEIVEELQKEFSNIVLINQENQGVSMARNNAIAISKGTYILPIDPDDYVVSNTFQQIFNKLKKQDLDVLYLSFEIFNEAGLSSWKTNYRELEKNNYNGIEGYYAGRDYGVKDPDRSWAILYKRELLDTFNIRYPKNVPYLEDGLFLGKVFTVATKVAFDNNKFYQRTTRPGSATNSNLFFSEKAIKGFIKAAQDIKLFAANTKLTIEQKGLVNHVVAKFVFLSIVPSTSSFDFKAYFKIIKFLKSKGLGKLKFEGVRFLYYNYIKVYNVSKLFFLIYFRFYKK